ncbi:hypothetical protein BGW41_005784 [Actinomortierella wolfii]|nr:hypothetical protein BGW41_005784 [Actinomortierella wolfii]
MAVPPLPPIKPLHPSDFYTIVVSGEKFTVSRNALEHDSPNFFTDVFYNPHREEYQTTVLYIDRNPDVFRDIVKHMQGYYVTARDEVHMENLIIDAFFFKLRRLTDLLRQTMFINVSGTLFKVSRDIIMSDSPNFFQVLEPFSPRNLTPTFICRSPDLFKEVLLHLQGYDIPIRDKVHRNNLLKEARYYKLNGLIAKLSVGDSYLQNGFPTKPEERVKPEVTMLLHNIKVKNLLVKGWREVPKTPISLSGRSASVTSITENGGGSGGLNSPSQPPSRGSPMGLAEPLRTGAGSSSTHDGTLDVKKAEQDIIARNKALVMNKTLQDILYQPNADDEPASLVLEFSSIEFYAIWPGSVHSSMLGDRHLLVFRERDLVCLNKICQRLYLQPLTQSANTVQLSKNVFMCLDGQTFKGQEDLEPYIRKLALTLAQPTPPGSALRLFMGRTLVRVGCRAGQLELTMLKSEGWSSDKEFNACRRFLSDDIKDNRYYGGSSSN